MKKLALLFLVLPIPAFASDLSDLRLHQAAEARTVCAGRDIAPESPDYAGCINDYLKSRYGWWVGMWPDGSLRAISSGGVMPASKGDDTSARDYNRTRY